MAEFLISYKKTSNNEGGYQDDHDDDGNWTGGKIGAGELIGTKFGISAPLLCDYLKRKATVEDMRGLAQETAQSIYRVNYWNPIRGDEIKNQEAADELYDMAVNAGVGTAINLCQRALGLDEIGIMSKTTLDHLNNK